LTGILPLERSTFLLSGCSSNETSKKLNAMDAYLTIENQEIPVIGLGTYGMTGTYGIRGMLDAIEIGYRHFDTAQMYNNEKEVGEAVRESGINRGELFITTKISSYNLDPVSVDNSVRRSVEKLGNGYTDLLLIHWPSSNMDLEAVLGAMIRLKEEGLTRHIGVSNFNPGLFEKALAIAPVICNQVEFSPYTTEFGNLEIARNKNIMITAYSPLGKGRVRNDSNLTQIGKKYNKTAAQTTLRWLLQLGNISVIPKASSEKHRRENFDVFDFELSPEDMERISDES
jgi:2,5-diketo-D-gluconate reductase B